MKSSQTAAMSQQAAARQGAPAGRGRGRGRQGRFNHCAVHTTKGFKSSISKIVTNTFNTGHNKFAAQFTQLHKNIANYLQRTSACEGYLVAEMVRTGREQIIPLPPAVDVNTPDAADLNIIRGEEVKTIAKRRLK
jgi:hypothetical protein